MSKPYRISRLISIKKEGNLYRLYHCYYGPIELVTEEEMRRIYLLNGTRKPLQVLMKDGMPIQEARLYLEDLKASDIIREEGRIWFNMGIFITVLKISRSERFKLPATAFMFLLSFALFPSLYLIISFFPEFFTFGTANYNPDGWLIGMIAGIILGLSLHEFAHAAACITFDGSVNELGLKIGLFPGAYAMINPETIDSRGGRIITYLAGVWTNLVLAGLFLFFAQHFETYNGALIMASIGNLELFIGNILFIDSFDGSRVLNEILGGRKEYDLSKILYFFIDYSWVLSIVLIVWNVALVMGW